ncbi:hypothetical protein [Nonomuraea basaltis]|uniref:hypothetical protein n=1 Tax=Nonomuraea basaltis TaxID=2495887 RepID=UPI00110C4E1A|nr:hypothetical protein [Nonomuraea basaltis]TMR90365.1 hypothetical protein EJK15_55670 [Nonomuraea basaltis]
MKLRFYGKGGSEQDECPSVSVDEDTQNLVFVGYPIDDPDVIAQIEQHSRIYKTEQAFLIPKELRRAIWEALGGHNPNFG